MSRRSEDYNTRRDAWVDAYEIAGLLAQDRVAVTVTFNTYEVDRGWPVVQVFSRHGDSVEVKLTAVPSYELETEDWETPWHWEMKCRTSAHPAWVDSWQHPRTTAKLLRRTLLLEAA